MSATALVVAGTDTRRDYIRAVISDGFRVTEAEGGLDALKRLRDEPADSLVTAVDLPDVSVDVFVERVLDDHPRLPIFLVGRPTDQAVVWRALQAGAIDHVTADDELARHVERAVFDRAAETAIEDQDRLLSAVYRIVDDLQPPTAPAATERVIYDRLHVTDLYEAVLVGRYDAEVDELSVSVPLPGTFDATDLRGPDDEPLIPQAVEERDVVSSRVSPSASLPERAPGPDGRTDDSVPAIKRIAAVPIDFGDPRPGIVLVTTARPHAFDSTERELLGRMGAITGYASRLAGRDDELPAFAENVVHELRNPIGIALAHLEIGRESNDPEALQQVEFALERVNRLVDNLATMADFEVDQDGETRDLADLASKAWAGIDASNAELVVEEAVTVVGDPNLLELLLSNLFRNAAEHGGEAVTIRVGAVEGGFFVEDDGVGIPESEQERVFERGYPEDGAGLGLGLSIVKQVVDAHGWDIDVESGTSGGARFVVTGVEIAEDDARQTDG